LGVRMTGAEEMDKKMRNLLLSGICLVLTVLGIIYQVANLKDGKSIMEYFGEDYEKSSEFTIYGQ
jgi:hypothetical protein